MSPPHWDEQGPAADQAPLQNIPTNAQYATEPSLDVEGNASDAPCTAEEFDSALARLELCLTADGSLGMPSVGDGEGPADAAVAAYVEAMLSANPAGLGRVVELLTERAAGADGSRRVVLAEIVDELTAIATDDTPLASSTANAEINELVGVVSTLVQAEAAAWQDMHRTLRTETRESVGRMVARVLTARGRDQHAQLRWVEERLAEQAFTGRMPAEVAEEVLGRLLAALSPNPPAPSLMAGGHATPAQRRLTDAVSRVYQRAFTRHAVQVRELLTDEWTEAVRGLLADWPTAAVVPHLRWAWLWAEGRRVAEDWAHRYGQGRAA